MRLDDIRIYLRVLSWVYLNAYLSACLEASLFAVFNDIVVKGIWNSWNTYPNAPKCLLRFLFAYIEIWIMCMHILKHSKSRLAVASSSWFFFMLCCIWKLLDMEQCWCFILYVLWNFKVRDVWGYKVKHTWEHTWDCILEGSLRDTVRWQ